jgi:hypothetical protein
MDFLIKSDQFAYRLYRPGGEVPETLPEHRVDGYRCIGHYTTLTGLLVGARNHLLKLKSKKAMELDAFLRMVIKGEAAAMESLKRLADATKSLSQ